MWANPNVMAALPNIVGALCHQSTPTETQSTEPNQWPGLILSLSTTALPHALPKKGAFVSLHQLSNDNSMELEMWANAQPDGRPAEYRWRPLFNAAKFG